MLTAFSSPKWCILKYPYKWLRAVCVVGLLLTHSSARAGLLLCGTCGSGSLSFAKGFSVSLLTLRFCSSSARFPGQKQIITPREMILCWQWILKQRLLSISQSPACYIHSGLEFADGESIAGMEAQETRDLLWSWRDTPEEKRGGNEVTLLWRSGRGRKRFTCRMEIMERKLPAGLAGTKGSQLSSHLQEKKIIEKSAALLVNTDEE